MVNEANRRLQLFPFEKLRQSEEVCPYSLYVVEKVSDSVQKLTYSQAIIS